MKNVGALGLLGDCRIEEQRPSNRRHPSLCGSTRLPVRFNRRERSTCRLQKVDRPHV